MLLAAVTIFLGINQFIPNVIPAFVFYGGIQFINALFLKFFCFVIWFSIDWDRKKSYHFLFCELGLAYIGLCLGILIASEVQVGQVHESDVFEMSEGNEKPKLDGKFPSTTTTTIMTLFSLLSFLSLLVNWIFSEMKVFDFINDWQIRTRRLKKRQKKPK